MNQLIKKLAEGISNSSFEVAAIEMSPQFHLQFVHELVSLGRDIDSLDLGVSDRFFMSIPILFVHGSPDYFKFLNNQQHKLRLKHINLLEMYNKKYGRLKNFISNSYKIENSNAAQFNQTAELESLVFRLNSLEKQIELLSA